MVWWDQELLFFSLKDQEVFALMPGIQTLSFSLKESAWKALDRVMALLWSGAGEGAKGRGFSFGFGSLDRMTFLWSCSNRIGRPPFGAIT